MDTGTEGVTPTIEEILALERAVWAALLCGDADADADLLSEAFLGVYPDGFAGRDDHAGQLHAGPTVAAYTLSDVRLLPVGRDHAMLCYLARFRRIGAEAAEAMYVSSLWQRHGDGGWRNLFSQDTPVGPGVP